VTVATGGNMTILSWVNNTSPCVWSNVTSNFTVGGPLISNAGNATGGGNETRAVHVTIEVETDGNESEEGEGGGGGGGNTTGSITWQGLWVMQRCEAEESHWCCNEGRRFGWCEPDSNNYVCLG